ncbi:hypothetical protein CNR22_14580 [Sphingobacteriaceae bacterium]|nr:hypothetical protein CNR22_14580 [Sphingobacteriaceae bacterium]
MKLKFLIVFFCALLTTVGSAQNASKEILRLPPLHSTLLVFPKLLSLKNPQTLKKDLSMKYEPAKLPFFCAMEEKSRAKFKIFFKFRAGNDESYEKMIGNKK